MGESVQKPAEYYMNNVAGTIVLLQEMKKRRYGILSLVLLRPYMAIPKSFQLPKIAKWAAQLILTAHQNIWLNRFYVMWQKPNPNLV
ncbi:UDP-glucose- 4-epimerase [Rodentibacter pneumotropicus]|uniref:UDP-glucose- 4-epimerase n=1 Tax=Rodentibacter pneumotropicus TaxID=758 RepID=A0A3S4VCW4_9PAST|nr:UDP-glucose- 4-epimerase [Rodentibacter pneumotropicus]